MLRRVIVDNKLCSSLGFLSYLCAKLLELVAQQDYEASAFAGRNLIGMGSVFAARNYIGME